METVVLINYLYYYKTPSLFFSHMFVFQVMSVLIPFFILMIMLIPPAAFVPDYDSLQLEHFFCARQSSGKATPTILEYLFSTVHLHSCLYCDGSSFHLQLHLS